MRSGVGAGESVQKCTRVWRRGWEAGGRMGAGSGAVLGVGSVPQVRASARVGPSVRRSAFVTAPRLGRGVSNVVGLAGRRTMVSMKAVATSPIEGQKTGTSGLRKKTKEFMSPNYLANWVQSLFNSLSTDEVQGSTMVLGGDGRYFNKEAAQQIIKIAAGNGVKKIVVGRDAYLSTPAASAVIRDIGALGGFIMSASHNPGGINEDFGIKFNYSSGQPAPERITDKVYDQTMSIKEIRMGDFGDVDLSKVGSTDLGGFTVEVIDPADTYVALMKSIFDFPAIKKLIARPDFTMTMDCMHAITGAYAPRVLCEELGAQASALMNAVPKEDFAGGHPDPNLTYAHELVDVMFAGDKAPDFGAASDGDGDRNMILGKNFFVTPSDSVAIISANASCIPYFKGGIKGLARSMPTSVALDSVAKKMNVPFFEVPTGWKFFGNLMDDGKLSICGEESFGTGSDHVREKDGLWAVLAWLNILAARNANTPVGSLVGVEQVTRDFWKEYGKSFYTRYDYEGCTTESANEMVAHIRSTMASTVGKTFGSYKVKMADDFEYKDPVDGSVSSKQGLRFIMEDGSRAIFRLSGTGSSGATIRMYIEKPEPDAAKHDMQTADALKELIDIALDLSQLQKFTGRESPTVIT